MQDQDMHIQEGGEQQGLLTEGAAILQSLETQIEKWELQRLLGGEYDEGGAMLSIQVWPCLYQTGCSLAQTLREQEHLKPAGHDCIPVKEHTRAVMAHSSAMTS